MRSFRSVGICLWPVALACCASDAPVGIAAAQTRETAKAQIHCEVTAEEQALFARHGFLAKRIPTDLQLAPWLPRKWTALHERMRQLVRIEPGRLPEYTTSDFVAVHWFDNGEPEDIAAYGWPADVRFNHAIAIETLAQKHSDAALVGKLLSPLAAWGTCMANRLDPKVERALARGSLQHFRAGEFSGVTIHRPPEACLDMHVDSLEGMPTPPAERGLWVLDQGSTWEKLDAEARSAHAAFAGMLRAHFRLEPWERPKALLHSLNLADRAIVRNMAQDSPADATPAGVWRRVPRDAQHALFVAASALYALPALASRDTDACGAEPGYRLAIVNRHRPAG